MKSHGIWLSLSYLFNIGVIFSYFKILQEKRLSKKITMNAKQTIYKT